MSKDKVECPKCVVDVGIGFFLKICHDALSDKIDCGKVTEQFSKGEISTDQLIQQIKDAAKNEPEILADLEEIDRIRKTGKIEP